jgi:transposase
MNDVRYVGMDVHKETVSVAVLDSDGRLLNEAVIEAKAKAILHFLDQVRQPVHVTLEEGTWAAWLYGLMEPHVTEVVVCDPRQNALLRHGSKADLTDARKLAELLRGNFLKAVYHGETGTRTLKELTRSYMAISKDVARVMNRLKALYRARGIACEGTLVYTQRHRRDWLEKITESGARRRAELLYQKLDVLKALRLEARRDLLSESQKHDATNLLCQIPCIGPIRAAQLITLIQTPHRFRTKRQLWTYCGLGLETAASAQYSYVDGQPQPSHRKRHVRGLNQNHNHDLKSIFKGVATMASTSAGPFRDFYEQLLERGKKPAMARLTLARKIAAIVLIMWKKGASFDLQHLIRKAA